ncbi:hypothetical protein SAMN04488090_1671 [Siphonobacter aquaeclarae]|uniref:Uncharacterized protein n=2 Tax=Siphonobacter aquaeclarae TaxID=563176 RepID=A0A1G9MMN2_9BACT|nr:hypothetical protein SAMN04488090_1671 [Siphonobacter aquaeclarae]
MVVFCLFGALQSCHRQQDVQPEVTMNELVSTFALKKVSAGELQNSGNFARFASVAEANEYLKKLQSIRHRSVSGKMAMTGEPGTASSLVIGDFRKKVLGSYLGFASEPEEIKPGQSTSTNSNWSYPFNTSVTIAWQTDYASPVATGYLTGFTMGYSFTQVQQTTSMNYSTGVMTYTINGTLNYNFLVEGIGTIYQQPFMIYGTYNTRNGDFIVHTYKGG